MIYWAAMVFGSYSILLIEALKFGSTALGNNRRPRR
jgi:hypothetical protein